jgi:hypothetical protein
MQSGGAYAVVPRLLEEVEELSFLLGAKMWDSRLIARQCM